MAVGLTTHELAELLGQVQDALKRGPDLRLTVFLKQLGVRPARRSAASGDGDNLPAQKLISLDPAKLSREELAKALQDKKNFRTKEELHEFARRYSVPVSRKARVSETVNQILRVLKDIPQRSKNLRRLDFD